MGSVVSGIFGGGSAGSSAPDVEPMPVRENEAEAESKAARDEEKRKIKARRGMSGTILTSPLGATGENGGGILGRTMR